MFTRDARDQSPTDQEEYYECDCGFKDFISGTCNCLACQDYRNKYGWTLTKCPECGELVGKTIGNT